MFKVNDAVMVDVLGYDLLAIVERVTEDGKYVVLLPKPEIPFDDRYLTVEVDDVRYATRDEVEQEVGRRIALAESLVTKMEQLAHRFGLED